MQEYPRGECRLDLHKRNDLMEAPPPVHDELSGAPFGRRRKIGLFAGPLLFALMLCPELTPGLAVEARRLLATSLLMALWWITEAIPMPATALLPMVLFPFLGILPMSAVTVNYSDEIIYLFLGGFFIAMAMQRWNLHKRLALHIIRLIGASPRRLVLGFMCATAFLSLWISNSATTMMMYPITAAVISQLVEGASGEAQEPVRHLQTCLMLGIAYASNIGGMGTLLGTAPNLIFASNVEKLFPDGPEIDFVRWASFGIPTVILFIPIAWLLMTRVLFPVGRVDSSKTQEVIVEELRKLGRMSRGERFTLLIFVSAALAWVFRVDIDLGMFRLPGWASSLALHKKVTDSTIAMTAGILLFLIPVDWKRGEFLLDWKTATKVPWGILLFFGGGLAVSAAFVATGLSVWVGERLQLLAGLPPLAVILLVCLAITFFTEVNSNTATATIFMPIAAATAQAMHMNPLPLMIAVAISSSCAFMLPVATAPNAIVFASGHVTVPQMAKTGFWLNLIGAVIITLAIYGCAAPVFDIAWDQFPAWAWPK